MSPKTKLLLPTVVLAGVMAAGAVLAQATPSAAPSAERVPMSLTQVIEHVTTLGYRDLREVERKGDKLVEVTARDAQGRWVELTLDLRSGELLRSEAER
ncbi:MAG TPA: PepSY domain-containing protein [Methylibium sp.]|nr:PepSY domain-containing protein [Methylibium sp.]